MSTNTFGEINVNSDLGAVAIDNETNSPIIVNDVLGSRSTTSASLSGVDIIDTNQPAASEQTLFVYQPGDVINEYIGTASQSVQQLEQSSPSVIEGNSTSYFPEAGLRWEWQLQATMEQNLTIGDVTTAGWTFDATDVPGTTANNPWYYLDDPNAEILDFTGTLTSGSDSVADIGATTVPSGVLSNGSDSGTGFDGTAGMFVGESVTGSGIPTGTTILSIDSSTNEHSLSAGAQLGRVRGSHRSPR